jgi:ubiquinone/menaquinone biosynthesis C-methylase UbiE
MALLARLNPDARFVGVDASATMLERARATLARQGMRNVELLCDDMTRLDAIADASKDCVVCTMSLHHAPDQATLVRTLRQVRRVLKPDGGFYLADFGRLRRVATQRFLANDRRQRQTAQFTQDFFNSLQAAFSVGELSDAVAVLGSGVKRYRTALAPFMVIFRSAARREPDEATRHLARNWYGAMTPEQRREFRNFCRWFRAGGLGLPFDPA